jgi:hypothetical protein
MTVVQKMLEKRDRRIAHAHEEVNGESKHYTPYKILYFLLDAFLRMLEVNPENDTLLVEFFPRRYFLFIT